METIDALLAFIQHNRDAAVVIGILWALVAFLALCGIALANSRIREDDCER